MSAAGKLDETIKRTSEERAREFWTLANHGQYVTNELIIDLLSRVIETVKRETIQRCAEEAKRLQRYYPTIPVDKVMTPEAILGLLKE